MPEVRGKTHKYAGTHLDKVAFPLGGIGAGMVCLGGNGGLLQISLRHKPELHSEPAVFGALYVKGAKTARMLEGPVPLCKAFGPLNSGNGSPGRTWGLPRFAQATFEAKFPFAKVDLRDKTMPVSVEVTGWSPLVPGDADACSLPVAGLEYQFVNRTKRAQRCVFSYHAGHFMKAGDAGASVEPMASGFVLAQKPAPDSPWRLRRVNRLRGERGRRLVPRLGGGTAGPCFGMHIGLLPGHMHARVELRTGDAASSSRP